ncbi:hypothetical protein [uncultured Dokdonia sp.]|uniref:HD domain-containing protein n=1 Tax=uncultured Dokdonia sp. TaxID=575653 RepID=UPI00260E3C7F|nr:hypothetical protein [uncultured Dokdonia sp.]
MENKHIYQEWLTLSQTVHSDNSIACFEEVEKHYTHVKRHYHTLTHIYSLFHQIMELKCSEAQKGLLAHAALFHDVIYKATAKDNELKSAQFAALWLEKLGIDQESQETITQLIIATASHTAHDPFIQLFLDMDLSILGATSKRYYQYCDAIRNEYATIPTLLYKAGRKRFLKQLLSRDWIFQTKHFQVAFEEKARMNIQKELKTL